MTYAEVGDRLIVPPGPHEAHARRVRWRDDEQVGLVVPPPDSRVVQPVSTGGGEDRARR